MANKFRDELYSRLSLEHGEFDRAIFEQVIDECAKECIRKSVKEMLYGVPMSRLIPAIEAANPDLGRCTKDLHEVMSATLAKVDVKDKDGNTIHSTDLRPSPQQVASNPKVGYNKRHGGLPKKFPKPG